MSRTRTFFTLVFPAMLAGGVLFGSTFTHADSGRGYGGYWPSADATVVAQADPRPSPRPMPAPPAPPAPYAPYATPPVAPVAPVPPVPAVPGRHNRHGHNAGINIAVHDGKIQIDGVNDIVESSIKSAMESIRNSNLPADVKDKLQKRLDKVRAKVEARIAHLDATDLDQLGEELGKMGDDIGKQMDEFGKEMEKYGEKMSKDAMKNFGKNWAQHSQHWNFDGNDNDNDGEDDEAATTDVDDQDDMDDAVRDLGNLSLSGPQREQIQRLRADSERQVAAAKRQLDQASDALQRQLDNVGASDAEIARAIDAVSQQEAAIRKARILAWHSARRMLDEGQRRKVEDAARSHKGH